MGFLCMHGLSKEREGGKALRAEELMIGWWSVDA